MQKVIKISYCYECPYNRSKKEWETSHCCHPDIWENKHGFIGPATNELSLGGFQKRHERCPLPDGVVYDYADVAITGEGDILIQVESRSYPYSYEWIPAPKGTQLIGGETKTFDLR